MSPFDSDVLNSIVFKASVSLDSTETSTALVTISDKSSFEGTVGLLTIGLFEITSCDGVDSTNFGVEDSVSVETSVVFVCVYFEYLFRYLEIRFINYN